MSKYQPNKYKGRISIFQGNKWNNQMKEKEEEKNIADLTTVVFF